MLLLTVSLVHGISYGTAMKPIVSLNSQSPDPVEPGQIFEVSFKVENNGSESKNDVILKLMPKFPFTLYGDVSTKNIGTLEAGITGNDGVIVKYKLKVDEKAVEGDAELELELKIGEGGRFYTNNEFLVDIQTHDAVLDIVSIESTPSQIAPGENGRVSIRVKNSADSLLKDIRFKLDFSESTIPLAPYQSSSERRISQLESSFQNSLTFNVIADPDAQPGLYKIPLNITYNDEKGNKYEIKDLLALSVGEVPKIRAYVKKSDVLQSNSPGKITLEIANAGTTDIKFLELTLPKSDDYELISTSNYIYIGDVDSDDTESEELNIFVNKKVDVLHLPVKLKYFDANNKPFQQQLNLELKMYSSSTLKKFGVLEKSSVTLYLFILILIFIFSYRWYRKNKKPELPALISFFRRSKKKVASHKPKTT
jgi:hypothetical protein